MKKLIIVGKKENAKMEKFSMKKLEATSHRFQFDSFYFLRRLLLRRSA